MKFTASIVLALSMAFSVSAQSSADALVAACAATRNACSTAPNANHAYCASQFFTCIAPTDACDCPKKSGDCLQNPPAGGSVYDCAPALAQCVVSCAVPITSTSVATPTGTAPVVSSSPTVPSNGTVVSPTISANPSATFIPNAGAKAGLSIVGVLAAGVAAAFL